MKSISFARIKLDGHHVKGLGYAFDDAQAAATLKQHGVNAKLYSGNSEGRVLDLVRQLVRMRTEAFSFHVEPYTLAPTLQLIKGIKSLLPETAFYVTGEIDGTNAGMSVELASLSTYLPASTPLHIAKKVSVAAAEASHVSPYQSGLLNRDDVAATGLAADPALAQELQWLAQGGKKVERIPVLASRENASGLADTLRALAAHGSSNTYVLFADARAMTPEVIALCAPALIQEIVLSGSALPAEGLAGLQGDARVVDQTCAQLVERSKVYGRNGNIAFHTGNYFDQKQLAAIYHLEIPSGLSDAERSRVYQWSSADMDIRSAVVMRTTQAEFEERAPRFSAPQVQETGGWPKHAYAIVMEAEGACHLALDGNPNSQQVSYVSLSELATASLKPDTQNFVRIKTAADVAELRRRLERFHAAGEIDAAHPSLSTIVENRCRWTAAGNCRVQLMRRISVDKDLRLSTCGGDTAPIGEVGMPFEQLVVAVKRQQSMAQVKRDCASCEVRDRCSQCSQLPGEWEGEYCSIRQSFPETALYFEMLNFPSIIASLVGAQGGATVPLKLSFTGLPPSYYQGRQGQPRAGTRPMIIKVGEQHIVWWKGQRRLIRISHPMAHIAEGWWLGAEAPELAASLVQQFGVTAEVAAGAVSDAMVKLQEQGVVHG